MSVARIDQRSAATDPLVERDAALAGLRQYLGEAATQAGRLVVVRGEAGIGKTALVREFVSSLPPTIIVASGSCDGVSTPRPLAPIEDMVPVLGRELGAMLDAGSGHGRICRWLRARLASGGLCVLVIEDIQWADDATLELLLYLARRLEGLTSLVLVTWRDDEALLPPIERIVGRLATVPTVRHLPLARLSRSGIAALAVGSDFDVDELERLTAGNPLYIHEVIHAGGDRIPVSIRDAIRARISALDARARRALESAAIAGHHPEPWLVAALAGEDVLGVDNCVRTGLLVKSGGLAFAHELTRMAVLEDLPVFRGIALHRRALDALRRAGSADSARLAHHAEGAADGPAMLEYAADAGRRALAMGALREAIAQFRRALRFAGALDAVRRADLLESLSFALYLTNQLPEAYAMGQEAVELRRGGDTPHLGSSTTSLALTAWLNGHGDEAWRLAREAVSLLEPAGDSHELGMAYDMLGRLAVSAGLHEESRASSRRALAIGDRLNDPEVRAVALANLGTIALFEGDLAGADLLEESLRLGQECGLPEVVDRALNNLGSCSANLHQLRRAEAWFEALEEHSERSEIERCSIDEPRAEIALARGDWAAAERHALAAVSARDPIDHALAQVVLARLEIRRGGGRADAWLAEPIELARKINATQLRWPLLSCTAERSWLAGGIEELEPLLRDAYAEACLQGDPWAIGEFGRWLSRAGALTELDQRAAPPYRREVGGDFAAAAREWESLEMPYDMAVCLAASHDIADLQRAHAELIRLGATAVADHVRARIRAHGARAPRGARPKTRAHPAWLTEREAEVAALLAAGLSNAEIADRLVLSTKTVAHHVSAVLAKLNVQRRAQVAASLGLLAARHAG